MLQLIDEFPRFIEVHGRTVLPVLAGAVVLVVVGAFVQRFLAPSWTPDELWKLKKQTIRALEDNFRGLTCAEAAVKVEVPSCHLKVVLEQLIEERFVVTEAEGGNTVYKLKRLQGVNS